MVQIDLMGFQGLGVGGFGLGEDQRVRATAAFGLMGRVELVRVNNPVQVLPPLLRQRHAESFSIRILKKQVQLPAIRALTVLGWFPPPVFGFLRWMGRTRF